MSNKMINTESTASGAKYAFNYEVIAITNGYQNWSRQGAISNYNNYKR